ncbi:hypothetical protein JW948_03665 [bacterium]|nr:hypothetical protein [bacterium]
MATHKKRKNPDTGWLRLLFFAGIVLFVLFLWGRVHIDFVLRDIDTLRREKEALTREVDDLNLQVNALQHYQRIKVLAMKQGLIEAEKVDRRELAVDFSGLRDTGAFQTAGIQVAGLAPVGELKQKLSGSPFEKHHGME